ncbi:SRPBCC family protein [Aurantiacibacter sediminis]|uniref:SRPBCC domain-containing protein n=1 Tax=Aurantiacibacter sediminis TaxID=2793064 RepID=A0ABS0N4H1_9SPHN|nr:SRPBCC domain-containing protein [Aurantiacibacter sediminis]MBH5322211.1 SRPBCC domain-containing protein [Aurantiacibacter sediminis]
MYRTGLLLAAAAFAVAPASASAEIIESENGGFASRHSVVVAASRADVWRELVHPENWWTHTWSNDAHNLHLDARAGGCFCEALPPTDGWAAGSVEHMRVVMVMPGSLLRMSGSLGPLQAEGLTGTLTVTLAEESEGTRITWDYITGGQARFPVEEFGPIVDGVQAEFLGGLVARLGDETVSAASES